MKFSFLLWILKWNLNQRFNNFHFDIFTLDYPSAPLRRTNHDQNQHTKKNDTTGYYHSIKNHRHQKTANNPLTNLSISINVPPLRWSFKSKFPPKKLTLLHYWIISRKSWWLTHSGDISHRYVPLSYPHPSSGTSLGVIETVIETMDKEGCDSWNIPQPYCFRLITAPDSDNMLLVMLLSDALIYDWESCRSDIWEFSELEVLKRKGERGKNSRSSSWIGTFLFLA